MSSYQSSVYGYVWQFFFVTSYNNISLVFLVDGDGGSRTNSLLTPILPPEEARTTAYQYPRARRRRRRPRPPSSDEGTGFSDDDDRRHSGMGILEFSPTKAGQDVTPANLNFGQRQRSGTLHSIAGIVYYEKNIACFFV